MPVEWIQNSPDKITVAPTIPLFKIDASTTRGAPPERLLTDQEVEQEIHRIQKPVDYRTFLIGPFGKKINPRLGRMEDPDIAFIEAVHRYYEGCGVDVHSCFRREEYGRLGIKDEDAEKVDQMLIETSHVLTVLPQASISNGTWTEIVYGSAIGRNFLYAFRESDPELEFQEKVKWLIRGMGSSSKIAFITFGGLPELFEQIDQVWFQVVGNGMPRLNGQ